MGAFPPSGTGRGPSRPPRRAVVRAAVMLLAAAVMASACALPPIDLPRAKPTIPPLNQNSLVFDANGHLITVLHAGENRTLIPLKDIPSITRYAVVAAEDERFYQHHGVDAKAIVRAAVANSK